MKILICTLLFIGAQAACPYSAMWMKYGPDKASEMIKAHHNKKSNLRRLIAEDTGIGSCQYQGFMGPDCKQFVGNWDKAKAVKACTGTFTEGGRCDFYNSENLAGYCMTGAVGQQEATGSILGGMVSSCEAAEQGCSVWAKGTFVKAGKCEENKKKIKGVVRPGKPVDMPTNKPVDMPTNTPMAMVSFTPSIGAGMCQYSSSFGGPGCQQYTGSGWTQTTAKADCNKAMGGMAKGTLTPGKMCPEAKDDKFAGYCISNKGSDSEFASVMKLGGMSNDCKSVANGCTTWSAGIFVPGGTCSDLAASGTDLSGAVERCAMGPGPMGGGHMDGRSPGYDENCKGTPAAGSKYMWPLRWSALTNSTSLPADPFDKNGKKKEIWHSYSKVWYDLSKNYKRMDMLARDGRSQFDYSPEDPDLESTTMVHRGRDMIFVNYYKNNSKSCRALDMSVIGNIRPDWFLDGRGFGSSSQFLGNQHVYYLNKPTLVKQWRKKDFASMYFVVSMAGEPDETGTHWPLIMDVPGEGFGEDAITIYWDHKLISEQDSNDDLFFPDKGLDCPKESQRGPEGGELNEINQNLIPSNLNVDDAGWVALEYTAAPNTDVPFLNDLQVKKILAGGSNCDSTGTGGENFKTLTLGDAGEMAACMSESGELNLKVSHLSESAVWAGIGFRPEGFAATDKCTMTPATAVIAQSEEDAYEFSMGELPKNLQSFQADGATASKDFKPISDLQDFSMTSAEYADGKTTFQFVRKLQKVPAAIHLTWAAGTNGKFSYHGSRGCVTLEDLPTCADQKPKETPTEMPKEAPTEMPKETPTEIPTNNGYYGKAATGTSGESGESGGVYSGEGDFMSKAASELSDESGEGGFMSKAASGEIGGMMSNEAIAFRNP